MNSASSKGLKYQNGCPPQETKVQEVPCIEKNCKFSQRLRIKLRINFSLPMHKMGSWPPLILGIVALVTLNTTAAEVTSRNSNAV